MHTTRPPGTHPTRQPTYQPTHNQPIQNTRAFAGAPLPRQMGVVSLGVMQAINRMSCWGVRGRFGCARKPPEGSDNPGRNPWTLGQGARQTALQALLARLITEAGESGPADDDAATLDPQREARALLALADGLTSDVLIGRLTAEEAEDALHVHLVRLWERLSTSRPGKAV